MASRTEWVDGRWVLDERTAAIFAAFPELDVQEFLGTPEGNLRKLHEQNVNFDVAHSPCTTAAYPDCWIVVWRGRVVASESTWQELNARINALGVNRDEAVIRDTAIRRGARA